MVVFAVVVFQLTLYELVCLCADAHSYGDGSGGSGGGGQPAPTWLHVFSSCVYAILLSAQLVAFGLGAYLAFEHQRAPSQEAQLAQLRARYDAVHAAYRAARAARHTAIQRAMVASFETGRVVGGDGSDSDEGGDEDGSDSDEDGDENGSDSDEDDGYDEMAQAVQWRLPLPTVVRTVEASVVMLGDDERSAATRHAVAAAGALCTPVAAANSVARIA